MARFRSIDPEFWRQPQLAQLPFLTRLILLGLVSQADDQGRVTAAGELARHRKGDPSGQGGD